MAQGTLQSNRLARALSELQARLDERWSVSRVGRLAGISTHHFHRQFATRTGVGVAEFIRLMRLKRASFRLVFERASITEIALDAGFANPESFTRAFRKAFGQSPRVFARTPEWRQWRRRYGFLKSVNTIGSSAIEVDVVDFPETKVAALEHRGPPDDVYNTTRRFIQWRIANGVAPGQGRTYGIHYNDHAAVKPEDYRIDICESVTEDVTPNPQGVVTKVIPGGRCAKARHLGSREHIACVAYIYRDWLPNSGFKLRDFPAFFHYVNVGPGIADHEMITDVYVPLE